MIKDELISNLNKIMRKDKYIIALLDSIGLKLDDVLNKVEQVYNNMFLDKIDEEIGIPLQLSLLQLVVSDNLSIDDKRASIQAKWQSSGHNSVELLQKICSNWHNGLAEVDFVNEKLSIKFVGVGGIPSDLDGLKREIEGTKPAFLLVDYIFSYLYWKLWDSWDITWSQLDSLGLTWEQLEKTIFKPNV